MSMKKSGRAVKLIQGKNVFFAPEGSHPSKVSGMFKDDPTFDEFLEILHEQREEDYRQTISEIERELAQEAKACLSSIPTPSRTTKKRHPLLKEKVSNTPRLLLFTTSITVEEQLKGRLAFINRHHNSPQHFTSNRRDFLQVPNLKIVDWTVPESNGEPG